VSGGEFGGTPSIREREVWAVKRGSALCYFEKKMDHYFLINRNCLAMGLSLPGNIFKVGKKDIGKKFMFGGENFGPGEGRKNENFRISLPRGTAPIWEGGKEKERQERNTKKMVDCKRASIYEQMWRNEKKISELMKTNTEA